MPPRVAIPMPHSRDREYAARALPQYERAVELAGGKPVRVPLDGTAAEVRELATACDAVLLPGSNADVDPAKFGAARSPRSAAADPLRDTVDELLLRDAYQHRKPVLGICYGLQSLNVFNHGSLMQHIPDCLPEELRLRVNHEAGKSVPVAHTVAVETDSRLAEILRVDRRLSTALHLGGAVDSHAAPFSQQPGEGRSIGRAGNVPPGNGPPAAAVNKLVIPVNSSHHQSADVVGEGLRVSARCVEDGIIEALEGTGPDHFVLAVQWHPERSVDLDEPSGAIFRALVEAAAK